MKPCWPPIIGNLKDRAISTTALINCFLPGLFISLAGSLPLGNLNITAMQFAADNQTRKAWQFAIGVVITEVAYLIITVALADLILANRSVFGALQWLTVVLFILLAIGSFRAGWKNRPSANKIINNTMSGWLLGLIMSAVNPFQFPFWAGWLVYLMSHGIQPADALQKGAFAAGAGAGTMLALAIFIIVGNIIAPFLRKHYNIVQYTLGSVFAGMALLQMVKIA